ncbi:uncharacterized protein DUF1631 [Pseudomonas duriflava]|uniref:Uncharacterized protein DUF1631 n=1 Tax=Pseudomonas duriflava TaxID=459528 RepID=A0A562QC92_9PSED|nr:DUF1631 domain-containing protein [Pseudomonas duriflava]TWI54358.1 uncharacterized protein DUF1631 [Pseudomonas duriflava]
MQNDANVIHFKTLSDAALRIPAALMPVRDKAAQRLNAALQHLFDNADDALFEMADRATSNNEQNLFFEAMRDLRLKRKNIERSFLQKYFERFTGLIQPEASKPSAPLDAISFEDLSLVQNDQLEESVALDTMVAKAVTRNSLALSHLCIRFNTQLSRAVDENSNPLAPRPLCEAFLDACRGLGVEIKVKLIILKLFERFVLNGLDRVYAEANQQLIGAGILPQLKVAPVRTGTRTASGYTGRTAATAPGAEETQELFGTIQGLLAQVRRGNIGAQNTELGGAELYPITSYDLMRLLSHLQQQVPGQVDDQYDLRGMLDDALGRISARSGRKRVVGQVDEDVINLVSMLFEFILDDLTLPASLKALIARLQIPMLKVAVLDKAFFSRPNHPARRLLNEIAAASLGWEEQSEFQRDGLYQKIEQVVQRLLNDFVDDPEIFSELLTDFLAYISDERRRSELLEQRTRDAEEGRARAELARRQVEAALGERLIGRTLPQVVIRVIREAWSQVLLLTCLKHGHGSDEWHTALQTMDDLIWSVEPHEDAEARQKLLEMVPRLLKALREGLTSAAFDPFSTSEFFTQLEALHVQTFQGIRGTDEVHSEVKVGSDTLAQMVEVAEEAVRPLPDVPVEPRDESVQPDEESLRTVEAIHVGSWIELTEADDHKLRCKLAAVIRPAGRYIFVNRAGMKVLEKTREALAVDLGQGRLRILDDALLFDRALESVIGNLRNLKRS